MTIDSSLVLRARAAGEVIAPMLDEIETERRLPAPAIEALAAAGAFKVCVPRAYGGAQASASTMAAVIEELARVDGSAGWITMIGATSGLMAVYLDETVAREIFSPADAVACGVFAPMGRAVPTADGYRVSGRWPFASGCEHARWRTGGAIVMSDPPDVLPSGAPNVRSLVFSSEQTTIHDTWKTSGLRGTGSHDMSVSDAIVPRERTFSLLTDRPRHAGYELSFFGVLAAGVASVGLGIARAAVDTASHLMRTKLAPGAKRPQSHRELVQVEVARAEARLRAARALLHEALAEASALATSSEPTDPKTLASRAQLRIAACHAATDSAAVTSAMYELGGGAAIYTGNPLQRQFRDAHVVTHHLMVSSTALTMAGRVVLGVETDVTML
jgi:alkylation response protein AidB-like acyl-CoA dehydrogenase